VLTKSAASHAAGDTTVAVQHVFPLAQAQDAFDQFAAGTLGKIVITTD
jgi:threonine dehydrogenase-like Zn-dependent dehydrogenase